MKFNTKSILLTLSAVFAVSIFTGCSAVYTAIDKRNLDVQTKMSNSIFLEPVAPSKQVVYVKIRNTTDKDINIEQKVKDSFIAKGFVITNNPFESQFIVQANLLQVGKSDARSAQRALASGFGGAIVGIGVTAATGGSSSSSFGVGALAGSLASSVGDALVKDVYYTMITDVEIRQRPFNGEVINQTTSTNIQQGSSASINQNVSTPNVKWKIYRTRVVSTANQVNLEFLEAKPALIKGLTRSLSGLL